MFNDENKIVIKYARKMQVITHGRVEILANKIQAAQLTLNFR